MSASISSIERDDGVKIGFTQIAGLVARRILAFVKEGDVVAVGRARRPDPLRQPGRRLSARRNRLAYPDRPAGDRRRDDPGELGVDPGYVGVSQ